MGLGAAKGLCRKASNKKFQRKPAQVGYHIGKKRLIMGPLTILAGPCELSGQALAILAGPMAHSDGSLVGQCQPNPPVCHVYIQLH